MIRRVSPKPPTFAPRVSVIVPCYNYGNYLPECVHSILAQPNVTADVLILDDASTDGSGEIADALAEQYDAVTTIRHQHNHGHIATYNEGFSAISGEYVVLISADDLLTAGALGRATALMTAHPSVGFVYGNPVVFSGQSPQPVDGRTATSWSVWKGEKWAMLQCRRATSLITSPEVVVRTDVQRQVGDYRPELPHSGDLEMWLRISAVSDVGRVNGPDQALKRVHDANMITTLYASPLADLHERKKAYEYFFAGSGASLRQADALRSSAWRSLAIEALEWGCEQLAAGTVSAVETTAVSQFAAELYPDYRRLSVWTEFDRRLNQPPPTSPAARVQSAWPPFKRDITRRARWHRWHRFGT